MPPHALIGKKAPEISLPDAKGGTFKFSPGTSGRPTVIFFYPKSGSYGCTKQVCQFRDALSEKEIYRSSKVEIVGISPDPAPKQKAFVEKQNVPYPILSDEKGDARKAYGVSRGLFGLTASSRVTFVIDSEGIIRDALDNTINYAAHAKFVNNWLSSISQKATPAVAAPSATTTNGAPAPAPAEAPAVPKKDEPSEANAEAAPVAAATATAPEVPEKEAKPSESTSAPAVPEKEVATTTRTAPEPTPISIPAPALESGAQATEDNHSPAGRAPSPEPTPSKFRAELPAASIGNLNEVVKAEPEVAKQIEAPAAELTAAPVGSATEQQSSGTTAAAAAAPATTVDVTVPVSASPEVVVVTKTPDEAKPDVEQAAGGAVAPNGDAKEVSDEAKEQGKQAEPGATPVVDQPAPTASPSN